MTTMIEIWNQIHAKYAVPISNLRPEEESATYAACDALYEGSVAKFRIAKITPKKIGQFVTLWKRENNGPIQPFNVSDSVDFVIIAVQDGDKIGQFIFPKSVLVTNGIFTDKKEGKRAIRVYPPWNVAVNAQAVKTQKWMLKYFKQYS